MTTTAPLAGLPVLRAPAALVNEYRKKLADAVDAATENDYWPLEIGVFDRTTRLPSSNQTNLVSIINDSDHKVDTYLRNIDALWSLGTTPYAPSAT